MRQTKNQFYSYNDEVYRCRRTIILITKTNIYFINVEVSTMKLFLEIMKFIFKRVPRITVLNRGVTVSPDIPIRDTYSNHMINLLKCFRSGTPRGHQVMAAICVTLQPTEDQVKFTFRNFILS